MTTLRQLWAITGRLLGGLLMLAFWYALLIGVIAILEVMTY